MITVTVQNEAGLRKALQQLAKGLDVAKQREIALAGSDASINIIQSAVPVRQGGPKKYYSKGKQVATFLPGHLRVSTQELGKRRKKIRDAGIALIGPVRPQRKSTPSGVYGKGRFDAYYAHMVFGSALAYQKRVTNKARQTASGPALSAMIRKAQTLTKQLVNRVGL